MMIKYLESEICFNNIFAQMKKSIFWNAKKNKKENIRCFMLLEFFPLKKTLYWGIINKQKDAHVSCMQLDGLGDKYTPMYPSPPSMAETCPSPTNTACCHL